MNPFHRLFFLALVLMLSSTTGLLAQQLNTIDSNPASENIIVNPPNNECSGAADLNALFGQAPDQPQTSEQFNTTNYTSMDDPTEGFECFEDNQPLSNTAWFSFVGDGYTYQIRSVACGEGSYAYDLQAVLYRGDCESLTMVACNEDEDDNSYRLNFLLEIPTEMGVTYLLMVDRFMGVAANEGNYCIEVTNLGVVGVTHIHETSLPIFPNPTTGTIQLPLLDLEWIEVYDAAGRQVLRQSKPGQTLDLGDQVNGWYILKLYAEEQVYSAKVMKQ